MVSSSLFAGWYLVTFRIDSLQTVDIEISLCSLVYGYEVTSVMSDVVLSRSNDLVFGVIEEFAPMGKPAYNSRNHEKDWEHIGGESHCLVNNSAIEVNVGVKFSFNEILVAKSDLFQFHCNFDKLFFACDFENFVSNSLDNFSSGVIAFVYSMSESVQQFFSVFNILNELRNILLLTDLLQHS